MEEDESATAETIVSLEDIMLVAVDADKRPPAEEEHDEEERSCWMRRERTCAPQGTIGRLAVHARIEHIFFLGACGQDGCSVGMV
jgi:hypothetical protein